MPTKLEAVNTNTIRRQQLVSRLTRDKQYRDLFVENEIAVGIPFQIRAMREKKNWTQGELGKRTNKRQSVISQLENPDYVKFTLNTLKSLASAFDVALMVRFVPFSEIISRAANLSEEDVAVPSFSEDTGLSPIRTASTLITMTESVGSLFSGLLQQSKEYNYHGLPIIKEAQTAANSHTLTVTGTGDNSYGRRENTAHNIQ